MQEKRKTEGERKRERGGMLEKLNRGGMWEMRGGGMKRAGAQRFRGRG